MTTDGGLNTLLAAVGGISGLAVLVYMGFMLYFARQKDRDIQEVRRDLALLTGKIEGLILASNGFPSEPDDETPDHEERDHIKGYGGIG